MNILFFIPAKGNSKGIERKNIFPLCGLPLISFSIMALRKSLRFFDKFEKKFIVSTDSKEISKVALEWGAEVPFLRPKELAQDKSDIIDAIFYTVDKLKEDFKFKTDIVFLVQPTSPLIEPIDIKKAFDLFFKYRKPLVSISEFEHPISWLFGLKDNKLIINKKVKHFRQAQKEKFYRPNGAIYIAKINDLKKYKSFYSKETMGYIMENENSIDIDFPLDLKFAEKILECKYKNQIKSIKIGNKRVAPQNSVFVIAEAGVNHNGNLEIAKKLVERAKEAGADAIKFQTFKAENVISKDAPKANYQLKSTDKKESQLEMVKNLELSYGDFKNLKEYCDKLGIIFLSTPFDLESVEFLENLKVPAFKIGSGDLTNYFLLKEIAKKKKPLILSTGMAYPYEIFNTLELLENSGAKDIAILHCTTEYPAKVDEVNLKVIRNLGLVFKKIVGFSDHTIGFESALGSVGYGASIIEKHFTLDKNMEGPDHKASLEPEELKDLISMIRNLEKSIGDGIKKPTTSEEKNIKIVRRSLFSKEFIRKGTVIEEKHLEALRPGDGISPMEIKKILGKKVRYDIFKGKKIRFEDLEG